MPKFYFHVDHGELFVDSEGVEHECEQQAREAAVRTCGQAVKEIAQEFWHKGEWRMHVTDDEHRLLFTLRVVSAVPSGEVTFVPRR
jgi:hypothetical protein